MKSKMVTPQVSIIMPIYNAGHTLQRMLNSILQQTFEYWELIAINDGSTDETNSILHDFARNDKRIKIINKSNEGVAIARQIGLDNSNGLYIIHADADDYMEPFMLEELMKVAKDENSDIIFCNFYYEYSNNKIIEIKQKPGNNAHETLLLLLKGLHGSCWNKLVKRSVLEKYAIKFVPNIDYYEDLLFWLKLFQKADIKISYLNKAFYHYVQSNNSITNTGSLKTLESLYRFVDEAKRVLNHNILEVNNYIDNISGIPFAYALKHSLLSRTELKFEYHKIRNLLWKNNKTTRHWLGLICFELNFINISRKLLCI